MGQNPEPGEAKRYWKSREEREKNSGDFTILSNPPVKLEDATRRDFLALMGFTLAAAGLTGCSRGPDQKAIPMLVGSEETLAGVPSWYATTCGGCDSACSLLVKTRDGRPIKVEGNPESPLFGGGTCAVGQATVLSLYDDERLRGPLWRGQAVPWEEIDRNVLDTLRKAEGDKRGIVLVSRTVVSPSLRKIIEQWQRHYPTFRHVVYDAVSLNALRTAQSECFGRAVIPHYRFDKARVIVGLEADFLGTWLSPVEFTRQYTAGRKPETGSSLSHHIQFESGFSITGSNADLRVPVAPSEMGNVAVALLQRITERAGIKDYPETLQPVVEARILDALAAKLWLHRGESLVVSSVQDVAVQVVVSALNAFLGNVGMTIDLAAPSLQRGGDDAAMAELVKDMNDGEIGVLILNGVNPAYDYPDPERFLKGVQKVALSISFSDRHDETGLNVHAICPDHHFLEAWGDAEPVDSHFSLAQPTIAPLFNTRAAQESLLRWLGKSSNYYAYLREFWQQHIFSRQKEIRDFDTFWDSALRNGVTVLPQKTPSRVENFRGDWRAVVRTVVAANKQTVASRGADRCEVQLYESVALRDGRHANNPWLQELPDPMSKVTWGNFAAVAPSMATRLGLHDGDIVRLKTEKAQIELPVFVQPGQQGRTISVALGYGRKEAGKAGRNVGANAYPLASIIGGVRQYSASDVVLEKTSRHEALASTQTHFSMEGRSIVQEKTLAEFRREPTLQTAEVLPSLWPHRTEGDHSWGMAIDLSACTGCSACVIACQAENNIAVVGKDQVQRSREMHWIRIDRYYSGPEENPASVHQPMMCQHCGDAPCETVCPVLATTHSSDGLNQQVYNRCIGTRYCANNCPYKVRRFNWYAYAQNPEFDFTMENPVARMVLNPDVTVRSRGVMEKCSLCIQRIQAGKLTASQEKGPIVDGDIQTACQQACPARAIVFGDFKDPESRVSQLRRSPRHYHVLEELGTLPNVGYLSKIRNPLET
jgi:molybdopterin-containing oxidoreductase family iron-sulfur binding subunit